MAGATETRKFAVEQVDKLLGQLAFQISRTLKSHDSGSVHDLRVAVRRFDQAFIAFKPCFPAKDVKKIRRRLKEIMALAGEVRNCDIALRLLLKSKLAEAASLRSQLQNRRKQADQILLGALKRWIQRKTSLKWRTRLQTASTADAQALADTVEETAIQILPRMAKEFFDLGKKAAAAAAELHDFRLAAKKFRYTLELFAPLYGPTLRARLEQVRTVQALLGGINDYATVREMLSQLNGSPSVDSELKKKQRKRTEAFRRQWAEEFASPANAGIWMTYLARCGERQPARKPVARSASAGAGDVSQRA